MNFNRILSIILRTPRKLTQPIITYVANEIEEKCSIRTQDKIVNLIGILNNIPRYGRLYKWDSKTHKTETRPQWRYMKNGHWGLNLISNTNLFWSWVDRHTDRTNNLEE